MDEIPTERDVVEATQKAAGYYLDQMLVLMSRCPYTDAVDRVSALRAVVDNLGMSHEMQILVGVVAIERLVEKK